MGSYYYFVCRESKKYLCLGKRISQRDCEFQGLYSDANAAWICDERFYKCLAVFVLQNPDSEFLLKNENDIPELDDYDELGTDELLSTAFRYKDADGPI